ncbi:hypothetical protein [Streptomyces pseudogriseolus]
MDNLTADITPQKRERIDAIKAETVDAERGPWRRICTPSAAS